MCGRGREDEIDREFIVTVDPLYGTHLLGLRAVLSSLHVIGSLEGSPVRHSERIPLPPKKQKKALLKGIRKKYTWLLSILVSSDVLGCPV